MVRALLLFLLAILPIGADVSVEVTIPVDNALQGKTVEGFIRVTHSEQEKIDNRSFTLDGRPLSVEFLQDSVRSSVTIINGTKHENRAVISNYRFLIAASAAGQYSLPPVTVVVGGRKYSSNATHYTVYESESSRQFRLEQFVRANGTLYPGQRAEFVYRLIYENPVDASDENLPLLEAKGFRKIGRPKVDHDIQGLFTIQEIVQEVEALAPGEYTFEAAHIEGRPYHRDIFGRRVYEKRHLKAAAHPTSVTVLPFPEQGKPSSFDGTIGNYQIETALRTPAAVAVGDRIKLQVDITGKGPLSTVHLPDLARHPGFQNQFRLSDLPPQGEEIPGGKRYTVELRPLSATISELPPITITSFDPDTLQYVTSQSEPIPLVVAALPTVGNPQVAKREEVAAEPEPPSVDTYSGQLMEVAGCFEIQPNELNRDRTPWSLLFIFPLMGIVWLAQWVVKEKVLKTKESKKEQSSLELLKKAKKSARPLQDIEAGLVLALYENNLVHDIPPNPDLIPIDGICGVVRHFVSRLHVMQYGSKGETSNEELIEEAMQLYRRIKEKS